MTNISRLFLPLFRVFTFFLCAVFSSTMFAAASNQYCGNETMKNHIRLNAEKLQRAALDTGTEVDFSRRELATSFIINSEQDQSMAVDLNFQYTIVDFDNSIAPMTNGHLHSWDFPVSWYRKGADYALTYYLAPVVSVSSNALKNPDLLDTDALQLWAGAVYKKELDPESAWLLGLRSDHRFGPYRVYPVAGFCWQPNGNWQLQLALPDFSISHFFSNGINIKLFAEPDGNKWHVFNKDTTSSSDFIYNAVVTGLSIEWQINPTVSLEFIAVKNSEQEYSFALDDGTQVDTGAQSSTGVSASFDLIF